MKRLITIIMVALALTACGASNPYQGASNPYQGATYPKATMQDAWAACGHCDLQSDACYSCISAEMSK